MTDKPAITGTLEAIHSRRDVYGNVEWALRFTDMASGKEVVGTVSGGEGNIYGILRNWNVSDNWDRSVQFSTTEMKIREFNRLVKDWPYAGSSPADLAQFIRSRLES